MNPAQLFRFCLTLPRPTLELQLRLPGAEGVQLACRALSRAELVDVQGDAAQLVAVSLMVSNPRGSRLAFTGPDQLRACLSARDLDRLTSAILEALPGIPVMGSPMVQELREGAQHPSNQLVTYALATSMDVAVAPGGLIKTERPDRYFGVPLNQLIDCHWLAYWAARNAYESRNQ